jgi:hypothetical protein
MSKYQGTVSRINTKQFGPKKSHTFYLQEYDGVLFKMGPKPHPFVEGQVIAFEASDTGQVSWNTITYPNGMPAAVEVPVAAPVAQPVAAQPVAAQPVVIPVTPVVAAKAPKFEPGFSHKDRSIIRQMAMYAAVDSAKFLVEGGLYSVGKTKAKALDTFVDLVIELTDRYYADQTTDHAIGPRATVEAVEEVLPVSDIETDANFQE